MADERFVWRLDPQTQAFLRDIARANEATRRLAVSRPNHFAVSSAALVPLARPLLGSSVRFRSNGFCVRRRTRSPDCSVSNRLSRLRPVVSGRVGQAFAFVREESDRLGLALRTAATGYAQLAAAARGTSIEGETTRELFLGAAEASTALGLSAEQTAGIIFALQQIISKGVVSAEEIRRQLGDRLPGAFQIAARSIGVTTQELNDLLSTGSLLSSDFLPAFARQLREEFGGQAAANVENLVARLNRLETASFDLLNAVGRGGLTEAIGDLADSISEAGDEAEGFGEELGGNLAFILRSLGETALFLARNLDLVTAAAAAFIASRIVSFVLGLVQAMREAIVVAGGLTAALSAGGWVSAAATGIGAIVGVITLLAQRTEDTNDALDDFRSRLAEVRGGLQDLESDASAAADELTRVIAGLQEFSRRDAIRALEGVNGEVRELIGQMDEIYTLLPRDQIDAFIGLARQFNELRDLAEATDEETGQYVLTIAEMEEAEESLLAQLRESTQGRVDSLEPLRRYAELMRQLIDLENERNVLETLIEDPTIGTTGEPVDDGSGGGGGGRRGSARRDRFPDAQASLEAQIEAERRLQAAVMDSNEAIEAARTETERLADIRRIEAEFTGEQRGQLIELTNQLYEEVEATERLTEATDGYREAQELVDELLTESADSAAMYAAAMTTLQELYNANKISAEQFDDAVSRLNERFGQTNDTGVEVGKTVAQAFREIVTDINNAEQAAARFLERLAEVILQAAIFGPIENALAGAFSGGKGGIGGFLGNLFGGGGVGGGGGGLGKKNLGGRVRAGRGYMVGENGPEPFIPTQDGIVLPNAALGGGGTSVALSMPITLNAPGADRPAVQALRREFLAFKREIPAVAISAVAREAKRGGGLAKTLKVRK